MAEAPGEMECNVVEFSENVVMSRKEKRKAAKKMKRKMLRRQTALEEREEQEARMKSPEELLRLIFMEEEETQRMELERKKFEEKDRLWVEAMEIKRKAVEHQQNEIKLLAESSDRPQSGSEVSNNEGCEKFEDGKAEIIWDGNEIIVKKKNDKRTEQDVNQKFSAVDIERQTSNPFPPQSEDFPDFRTLLSSEHMFEDVTQQIPNFGTEQDKSHCPFHFKTGACRFGHRCNRLHMYPDKSCTLLMKNMYHGPGILCDQDEGLEYTDEEINHCFEEFYEDAHTEFLKFGEIVNFKVCKNNSFHLRGNVYVHYKSMDSAIAAHHTTNARYFAGKQVNCEYVCVTKWKTAICGEYMKSRFKTCSRGTACNFIHCFRNPGGDYEWADSDRPPPRYWIDKMLSLFGSSASPPDADECGRTRRRREDPSRVVSSSVEEDVADKKRRSRRREKEEGERDRDDHYRKRHSEGKSARVVKRPTGSDKERMGFDYDNRDDRRRSRRKATHV